VILLLACGILASTLAGCRGSSPEDTARTYPEGAYPVAGSRDCLSGVTLTDQHGQQIALDSLKGKLVLIDFIYTACPGPCEMMTAKIAAAARALKSSMGNKLAIVSVTLDPERDHPAQLLKFAEQQGAEQTGWLFLTGPPDKVETLMGRFKLKRQREPDGSVDHATIIYLLDRNGRQIRLYNPSTIKPDALAADIRDTLQND
jgi:cytochrome oxidase Cu insertion factor (SCO1/SenC/PrrC family)